MDAILRHTAAEINEILAKLKVGGAATPSGDPMHYAYEAVGAVWDATSGCWKLNGLSDLTKEDMARIYGVGRLQLVGGYLTNSITRARTNIPRLGWDNTYANLYGFAWDNDYLEVINLTLYPQTIYWEGYIYASASDEAFRNCPRLRAIYGKIVCQGATGQMFEGCAALERVRVYNLDRNLSFASSPLDVESVVYLLQNASSSATFSVTLRADRQTIYEANADFVAAKNARPNVTILYQ